MSKGRAYYARAKAKQQKKQKETAEKLSQQYKAKYGDSTVPMPASKGSRFTAKQQNMNSRLMQLYMNSQK